ncbi:hypothetical protein JKP88DRAFT_354469 [Tribonema minus]|uniref:Uncharacterized protein n=1 Tax=Tribonema minus TaxID=303371 RepID=A0A836CGD3_9STRA|nr:hypothetical protein JKP88DRAFT_354469 [Tribonema minus]
MPGFGGGDGGGEWVSAGASPPRAVSGGGGGGAGGSAYGGSGAYGGGIEDLLSDSRGDGGAAAGAASAAAPRGMRLSPSSGLPPTSAHARAGGAGAADHGQRAGAAQGAQRRLFRKFWAGQIMYFWRRWEGRTCIGGC